MASITFEGMPAAFKFHLSGARPRERPGQGGDSVSPHVPEKVPADSSSTRSWLISAFLCLDEAIKISDSPDLSL